MGFDSDVVYEKYILSQNPVDILSFDNTFIESDIAQCMIFKGKRSGIIRKSNMDVDPGYKRFEKFLGGVQWYMTESKYSILSNCPKLKNENNELVSVNGQ